MLFLKPSPFSKWSIVHTIKMRLNLMKQGSKHSGDRQFKGKRNYKLLLLWMKLLKVKIKALGEGQDWVEKKR